jgi:hypothetical protein
MTDFPPEIPLSVLKREVIRGNHSGRRRPVAIDNQCREQQRQHKNQLQHTNFSFFIPYFKRSMTLNKHLVTS